MSCTSTPHITESYHTWRWVTSHLWMSHITHANESRLVHICKRTVMTHSYLYLWRLVHMCCTHVSEEMWHVDIRHKRCDRNSVAKLYTCVWCTHVNVHMRMYTCCIYVSLLHICVTSVDMCHFCIYVSLLHICVTCAYMCHFCGYVSHLHICVTSVDMCHICGYRVTKTNRIPYLCRSFSAKVTYI